MEPERTGLSDEERKTMNEYLKIAFNLIKKSGYNTEKSEKLMDELNKLYAKSNQLNLF